MGLLLRTQLRDRLQGWAGPHVAIGSKVTTDVEDQCRTVLHVVGVLDRGGVERRTLELLEALRDEPIRFVICTLTGRDGELAADYRRSGAVVVPIGLRTLLFPARFVRLIRRERVDVVHSHVLFASGYILLLAAIAGVKNRIAQFNSDAPEHGRSSLRRLRYFLLSRLLDLTATQVVGVAPSALDGNWGRRWRSDNRFSVVPSGVDLGAFRRPAGRPLRGELGIDSATSLVLHLGRADVPSKNRELAVAVLAECRDRGQPVELVFVGRDGKDVPDGERNRSVLAALARARGADDHVHFLGERSDVPEILTSSDALLFTSRREGLPGVLLESVASGVPVVASDLPGAIFIAERVEGVTIVRLSAAVTAWADALTAALRQRRPDPDALKGSIFDLNSCVQSCRDLWCAR